MYIVWMLVIGLLVGIVARVLMPGRDSGGLIITILLGVAGSIVAGLIGRALGWYHGDWSGPGFLASVGGAMLLLLVYRLVNGSSLSRGWRR